MTTTFDVAVEHGWRGKRVLIGLSRAQERRLRGLWLEESDLRVVGRCGSAPELLCALERAEIEVALVDEDLHRFDSGHRAATWQAGTPIVALVREPDDTRWRDVPGTVLPLEVDLPSVLDALGRAATGDREVRARSSIPTSKASGAHPAAGAGRASSDRRRIQVVAFWSGRGHAGASVLACSCAAILGSAAPTVLVDLDIVAPSVGILLDDGGQARVRSSLGDLLSADLDTHEAWTRELERCLQPMGAYARHAQVLCGAPYRRHRGAPRVSAAFLECLIAELRSRFDFVVLDVGADPPGQSQVTTAALRSADQVLVAATPDPIGLHRAGASVQEAAAILDERRAALVLNRYDARVHTDLRKVDEHIGLPVVLAVPEDERSVQKALLAGHPAVCEPGSRLRSPLLDLMDRVCAGSVAWPGHLKTQRDPWAAPPLWARLRNGIPVGVASVLGGAR